MGDLSRRDLLLALVTPVLLTSIAAVQLYRAHTLDQSSWSGAGFGMFATYESELTRFVRIYAITEGSETPVPVPLAANRAFVEATVVPTDPYLETLGRATLDSLDDPDLQGLRVELWSIDFNRSDTRIDASILAVVEIEPDEDSTE